MKITLKEAQEFVEWGDRVGLWNEWTVGADPECVMSTVMSKKNSAIPPEEVRIDVGQVELELQSGDATKKSSYPNGDETVVVVGHTVRLPVILRKWRVSLAQRHFAVTVPADDIGEFKALMDGKGWKFR